MIIQVVVVGVGDSDEGDGSQNKSSIYGDGKSGGWR